jgi:hypothetical protein
MEDFLSSFTKEVQMKNLQKLIVIMSVLLGFSSASAMDMCDVTNLQVGDEIKMYLNFDGKIFYYQKSFVTSRTKHSTSEVADLIMIEGHTFSFPNRTLLSRVFCQDNVLIIDWISSMENGVYKTYNKKQDYRYQNGNWGLFEEGVNFWLEITKKTSLASN